LRAEGYITARMDGRVDRYEQHLSRKLKLSSQERAVLCVLMLRSALTLNEIRINTARMTDFESADALQEVLQQLMQRDEPLLVQIPRAAGQREDRYAHLLCGELSVEAAANSEGSASIVPDQVTLNQATPAPAISNRVVQLEQDVSDLKEEVQQLRQLIALLKT